MPTGHEKRLWYRGFSCGGKEIAMACGKLPTVCRVEPDEQPGLPRCSQTAAAQHCVCPSADVGLGGVAGHPRVFSGCQHCAPSLRRPGPGIQHRLHFEQMVGVSLHQALPIPSEASACWPPAHAATGSPKSAAPSSVWPPSGCWLRSRSAAPCRAASQVARRISCAALRRRRGRGQTS